MPTSDLSVQQYALKHHRLHPEVVSFLQPLFPDIDLETIRIVGFNRNTSALGTSVWVAADKIIFRIGKLNAEYIQEEIILPDGKRAYRGNAAIDLSTVGGMTVLCHEIRHCVQWRNTPFFKYIWGYLMGLFRSWRAGRFYSHAHVPSEIDAIDFERNVARPWVSERADGLRIFEKLR